MPRPRRTPVAPWRDTPQRLRVLRALAAHPGFSSARVLHARMAADGHEVGLSTVYRALAALVEAGQVDVVRDDAGERLFRHRRHDRHEHYLVCRECGFALALDVDAVEAWAERIARESGFSDVRHTVEFAGVCVACDAVPSPRPPTDRSHP